MPQTFLIATHTSSHTGLLPSDYMSVLSNIPIYHNHTHLAALMTPEQRGESKHSHMGKVMKVQ